MSLNWPTSRMLLNSSRNRVAILFPTLIISRFLRKLLNNMTAALPSQKAVVAASGIASQVSRVDPDGIDIVCFGGDDAAQWYRNVKSTKGIEEMVNDKRPRGVSTNSDCKKETAFQRLFTHFILFLLFYFFFVLIISFYFNDGFFLQVSAWFFYHHLYFILFSFHFICFHFIFLF